MVGLEPAWVFSVQVAEPAAEQGRTVNDVIVAEALAGATPTTGVSAVNDSPAARNAAANLVIGRNIVDPLLSLPSNAPLR